MSEPAEADSFAQRLAIGRLSNPGVLDRRVLQRAHDRYLPSTRAAFVGRLQRRVMPAAPGAESLPFARIDRAIDVDAASTGFDSDAATSGSTAPSTSAFVARPGTAVSVAGSGITRSIPTISRTPAIVARRVVQAPVVVAGDSTVSRLSKRSEESKTSVAHASLVVAAGARSNVQPVAESVVARRQANAEPAVTNVASESPPEAGALAGRTAATPAARVSARGTARASALLLMRKVDAPAQAPVARPGADSAPAVPASTGVEVSSRAIAPHSSLTDIHQSASSAAVDTGSLPSVTRESVTGSSRLVWRKSDAATPTPAARALPAITAAPTISIAPQPLVLRKAVVPSTRAGASMQPPSISTAPASVIARTHDAHGATSSQGEAGHADDWNIEWIAEQVGKRLARRLEIERERTGIRPWRQAN